MKIILSVLIALSLAAPAFAQSRSVWIEDYSGEDIVTAVDAGKTTLIYCVGSTHADGPVVAVGKHNRVTQFVMQRVAEELGNALVLPILPYAQADSELNLTNAESGKVAAGTVSLSDEVLSLVTKEVVNSELIGVRTSEGLKGAGFKNVLIMGDHGPNQEVLKKAAKDLDQVWKGKGVRIYYINLSDKSFTAEKLKNMNNGIAVERTTPIEDDVESWALDPKYIHVDKIEPEDRKFVSPELGKAVLEHKIASVVEQFRKLTSASQ
jgi:creatinine amidohydrolase/Fe(II)-dependent formamide hydrolase-like protein